MPPGAGPITTHLHTPTTRLHTPGPANTGALSAPAGVAAAATATAPEAAGPTASSGKLASIHGASGQEEARTGGGTADEAGGAGMDGVAREAAVSPGGAEGVGGPGGTVGQSDSDRRQGGEQLGSGGRAQTRSPVLQTTTCERVFACVIDSSPAAGSLGARVASPSLEAGQCEQERRQDAGIVFSPTTILVDGDAGGGGAGGGGAAAVRSKVVGESSGGRGESSGGRVVSIYEQL